MDMSASPTWLLAVWAICLRGFVLCQGGEDAQGGDYCEFDTFHAVCPDDHVILMKKALYGRMELGRCVVADLGYVGCSADVLDIADRRCSGKRQCKIVMPFKKFSVRQPCLTELKSYLEASYTCQKVTSVESRMCRRCDFVKVTHAEGYIASVLTKESGCGSPDCPWLIQVLPGQRVNVTLVNFAWSRDGTTQRVGNGEAEGCQVFGTIKEDTATRSKTVCSGSVREQQVYLSITNSVELRIVGTGSDEDSTDFLFKYQAVGCADPDPPRAGWMRRVGDVVTMGCNQTSASWELRCVGTAWQGETGGECAGFKASASLGTVHFGKISMPYYVSIAIVILVAVVVGALILTVGLIIVKRHYSNIRRREAPYSIPKEPAPAYKDSMYMSPHSNSLPPPKTFDTATLPHYEKHPTEQSDNSYAHIWERPLPDPAADPRGSCTCPSSPYGTQTRPGVPRYDCNTLSHLDTGTGTQSYPPQPPLNAGNPGTMKREFYGNNTMARREIEPDSGSDDDPRYYSLDPDGSNQRQT